MFLEVKQPGHEANRTPSSVWRCTYAFPDICVELCLVKHQGQLYLSPLYIIHLYDTVLKDAIPLLPCRHQVGEGVL
jgi:hypothetical protein